MDCLGVKEKMHQKLYKNNVDYDLLRNKLRKNLKKTTVFFRNPLNLILLTYCSHKLGKDEFMVEKEKVIGTEMVHIV